MLLTSLLIIAPVQYLDRTAVQSNENVGTTILLEDQIADSGDLQGSFSALFGFGLAANRAGVSLMALNFYGEYSYVGLVDVSPLDGESFLGTSVGGGHYACGNACTWGGDWISIGDGNSPQPFNDRRTFSISESVGYSFSYNDLAWNWEGDETHTEFDTSFSVDGSWSASTTSDFQTSEPEDVYVHSAWVEMDCTATYSMVLRYEALPAIPYCASQQNSTGLVSELELYGNGEANSEYLAVRVKDLAPGSAGILFRARAFGNQPAATYTLCLGAGLERVGGVQFDTSSSSQLIFDIDLSGYATGSTAYFQAVHRDPQFDICASRGFALLVQ